MSINEEESELKIVHALIKLSRWLPNIFVMNKRQKWKSENFLWHQQHSSKSKSSSSAMIVKIFSCLVENVRVKVLKCFHSFPIKLCAELLARHRWFTQIMYIEMSQIIEQKFQTLAWVVFTFWWILSYVWWIFFCWEILKQTHQTWSDNGGDELPCSLKFNGGLFTLIELMKS